MPGFMKSLHTSWGNTNDRPHLPFLLTGRVRLTEAKKALDKVLRMEDAEEIAGFLDEVVPSVS